MGNPRIPICVSCRVRYRCEKNSVVVNDPAADGFPATYWMADRFECPGCQHQIISGFSQQGTTDPPPEMRFRSLEFRYDIEG
jgi:hypothetical protein